VRRGRANRVAVGAVTAALLLGACESGSPTPSPSASQGPASLAPEESEAPSAYAGLWENATAQTIGTTSEWTNKVEVADLNGDGYADLIFPNGGDYDTPGTPVATQVFFSNFPDSPQFTDVTDQVMGDLVGITRVAKVADLDMNGTADVVLGTTYQTQSQLLLGTGDGNFTNATAQLPQIPLKVGDVDIGDVDGDGDLDLVLADWGPRGPIGPEGGRVQLWLNDGSGRFTDATAAQMPSTQVRFTWELDFVDVDNDWDLDLAVSAKLSTSVLFENDGSGHFTDVTEGRLPQFTNNYEFEAMDLDGDGYLDLVTINDGDSLSEHVFRNDRAGGFEDVTAEWWPPSANPGEDDNNIAFLDVDSDGDADFLIGSLTGPDRLMINDGSGHLTMELAAFDAPISAGTLGMTVVDLDRDGRLDVVEAQGENSQAMDERVYLATDRLAPDTSAPVVRVALAQASEGGAVVFARAHDFMAYRAGELTVVVTWDGAGDAAVALSWYGEFLFRGIVDIPAGVTGLRVCATDLAGNEGCTTDE